MEPRVTTLGDTALIDPDGDLARVEADVVADLHERNATLVHEPSDMADPDSEYFGYSLDVEERGQR
jgi:hypothetical protein